MHLIIERNVRIPMRDGVELATDVYRPDISERVPVVITRTPYDRTLQPFGRMADGMGLVEAGYAMVMQDTRGCFASDGVFEPFVTEEADGFDTIAWAVDQPWSSGQVGMVGSSYVGATQWLAAMSAHPALRCIAPHVTGSDYHEAWSYQGGAFELGFCLSWAYWFALAEANRRPASRERDADVEAITDGIDELGRLYRVRPLVDQPILRSHAPYYADSWLRRPDRDAWWKSISPRERYADITVPALNIGGWYDIFVTGTIENYTAMRGLGATAAARTGARLLIGPWSHGTSIGLGHFPERRHGTRALSDSVGFGPIHQRWFDHWLRGVDNGVDRDPPVRIFVMGLDRWRDEPDWPLPDTDWRRFYLHSGGRAGGGAGEGLLSFEPPMGPEPEDHYLYDPRDPVPSMGGPTLSQPGTIGQNAGPFDQRPIEGRADVLCYTSDRLEAPLEVTGPVELRLYARSTAVDTDFTAKLVDVWPDGRAENLTDGIMRARYREGLDVPRPLDPNTTYELRIDVGPTSNVFLPGHRLRLEVSSSNFPRFDANTNTGGLIAQEGHELVVPAVNRVFHDRARPSHLMLPIIDRPLAP